MQSLIDVMMRLVALEERVANSHQFGKVTDVDPKTGKARMRLGGEDDKPYKSPEMPYGQIGGALKVHSPVSVGQQVMMIAQDGDPRRAVMIPMTFSDDNKSPSESGDEHVMTLGTTKVTLKGDEVKIERGGAIMHMKSDGSVEVTGPTKFKSPATFEKGFTAKAGEGTNGAAARFEGTMHATNDITSDTKVEAPAIRGDLQQT